MRVRCFLFGPTKKFSPQNGEKTGKGKLIKWASKNTLRIHFQVSNVWLLLLLFFFILFFIDFFFPLLTCVDFLLSFIIFYFLFFIIFIYFFSAHMFIFSLILVDFCFCSFFLEKNFGLISYAIFYLLKCPYIYIF